MATLDVNAAMGRIGLPAPLSELSAREWDAIVVGGGHNGLTAAAYLARAGRSVLVLERREQLGGACTLEQPFSDSRYLISPCAYVVGLLDELVIRELELERLLGDDDELVSVAFEESVATTLDRYIADERIKHALFGQGVIGAFAGPRDPGTASVRLMHHQGDLLGRGSFWGYVEGGMGRVSFAIAQAALESGANLATGVPVARIVPGHGVEVETGELIRAPIVLSNADPKRTLALLGADAVPSSYRERIDAWRMDSPVVKLNAGLRRLPAFTAAGSAYAHRSMVTITGGLDAAQNAVEECRRGEPSIGFAELYFQSAYDSSVAPAGRHTMSVFAQYAPYQLADGNWDSRRAEIAERILDAIAAYAPEVHDCVEELEVLGPPAVD